MPPVLTGDVPALLTLNAAVRGADAERLLLADATAKPLLSAIGRDIDMHSVLSSVNGLTLSVTSLDKDFNPAFCLMGTAASDHPLPPTEQWVRGDKDKGRVWFASQAELVPQASDKSVPSPGQGERVGFEVDLQRLAKQPCIEGGVATLLRALMAGGETMNATITKDGAFQLEIK